MSTTGGNNNAKIQVDLELKDEALRKLKKQWEDAGKSYEDAFRKARKARASGGKYSPGFVMADEDLKANEVNVKKAREAYEKEVTAAVRRNQSAGQRVKGFFHTLWYGSKAPDDPEQAQRLEERRLGFMQRRMTHLLSLSANVSRAFAPLPGGAALHSGLSGLATGFEGGMYDELGRRRKGLSGLAGGLAGGLKGAATGAGLVLLAKAVSGAVEGERADENVFYKLSQQAGGDTALGRNTFRGRNFSGMRRDEALPYMAAALRAGGGAESARMATRAQVTGGFGNEYNQLLSTLAQTGANTTGEVDANAKRLWVDILATGTAQGLQKGRIGELIAGANAQLSNRLLGTTAGDPSQIFRMAAFLGKSEAFKGGEGFKMMSVLNSLVTGGSSPLANSLALLQNGLGQGTSLVEAMRRSERGLFTEGSGDAFSRVKGMVDRFSGMSGGNDDMTALLMKSAGGMSLNAADELIKLVRSGEFNPADFDRIRKNEMSTEEKAWESMIAAQGDWHHIDGILDDIKSQLGNFFKELGGPKGIVTVLTETRDAVVAIRNFVLGVKSSTTQNGVVGGIFDVASGNFAAKQKKQSEVDAWIKENLPGANILGPKDYTPEPMTPEQKAAYDAVKKGIGIPSSHERFFMMQDKEKKMHLVVELRDNRDNLLAIKELRSNNMSTPPQTKRK